MDKKSIKNLKKLMADWNELGDKYRERHKDEIFADLKVVWLEKSNNNYKSAKLLRECLLKCGVDLEE